MFSLFKRKKSKNVLAGLVGLVAGLRIPFGAAGILVVVALLGFVFRPYLHDILIEVYIRPSIFIFLALLVLGSSFWKFFEHRFAIFFWVLSLLFLFAAIFSTGIAQMYAVDDIKYASINRIDDSAQVILLPRAVAEVYMTEGFQEAGEKTGELDLALIDSKLFWTAPRIPESYPGYFTEKVKGLVTADAERSERSVGVIDAELKAGEGIGIGDNIYWKIYYDDYLVRAGDVFYVKDNDEIHTIVPIIKYKFKFPVMVPYFAGVYVFTPDGSFEKLGPAGIESTGYLKNSMAFPAELAGLYAGAYKYRSGIWNALVSKKDLIEIPTSLDSDEAQPFFIPMESGSKWVVVAESGENSTLVSKIFIIDAVTGKAQLYNPKKELASFQKAVSGVKNEFGHAIDWAQSRLAEPRPVILGGRFYWMLSITTSDFEGVIATVFVDAETNQIFRFDKDAEVRKFVDDRKAETIPEPAGINGEENTDRGDIGRVDEIERVLRDISEINK